MNLVDALERRAQRGPTTDVDDAIATALAFHARSPEVALARQCLAADGVDDLTVIDMFGPREMVARRHRDRRSHAAWWTVAAGIVIAFGVAVAVVRDDAAQAPTANAPDNTVANDDGTIAAGLFGPGWTSSREMKVFVKPHATTVQLDAIRRALKGAATLDPSRLEYLDTEASLALASLQFADDPEGFALLTPDNIPTLFRVFAIDDITDLSPLKTYIRGIAGVNGVALPINGLAGRLASNTQWSKNVDMVVYLDPHASQYTIDTVRQTLLDRPAIIDVAHITLLTGAAAKDNATLLLAGDPQSIAALTPSNTPILFQVATRNPTEGRRVLLQSQLVSIPGVIAVQLREDAVDQTSATGDTTTSTE